MLTASQYRMRAIALLSTFVIVLVLIFMPLYPDLKPGTKTDGLNFNYEIGRASCRERV